ncbi:hypothetical protein E3Z27_17980 [Pseudomonas mediterranea]|jgi:uncharacterized protein HemX|uniref:DUF2570 domain-containing protein n=1 Tax=Pseudomonas mediterranea TaxID=183795 RepID=A0AAX2DBJ1_9PSED|nr:hypothetical protein [Pseudomonas mediterranea]KGU85966.1 hypothetical protein N005_07910 [Pseudomonas mediterranea CFBP 5447]MBL0843037.1 hypothetical protein [Pseudomonas mediterranea]MDU9028755.1 hypothetical protein [Pseudomonas mediterranea]QHA83440.1 hypothetical protein E3Z27_17980 [Pseudomonas mediterranea]UZD99271.1 hypothetical protein LOY71_17160 [Pseudomonas mediterranea]
MNTANSLTPSPSPGTPWLTTAIALGTFIVGIGTTFVVGGMNFGQQKNALENQTTRNQELQKQNDELAALLQKWREAVAQRDELLASTQSRLAAMQNDQCEAIRSEIDDLENSLSWADNNHMSELRRSEINRLITQHQQSLQSCFAARR